MTIRMFKKVLLDVKRDRYIFFKCCRSIHYISSSSSQSAYKHFSSNNKVLVGYFANERKLSKTALTSSHRQIHSNNFKGSLYNNETVLAKRIFNNPYPIAVNSIRHYYVPQIFINNAITYNRGYLQMISECLPVQWATEILRLVHYEIGLPWWATIILTTVVARTIIHVPLSILDYRTRAKRENLEGEMKETAKTLKMEMRMQVQTSELSPSQAAFLCTRALRRERRELYERENCHPFKSIAIILLQGPIWISFSVAVRNICFMLPQRNPVTVQDYLQFTNGGFGWMRNLADIDHAFVLPILFGLSGLAMIEINEILFNIRDTKFRKIFRNVSRVLVLCFVPFTACIPSGLSLYWVTNNYCAMLQNLIFLSPKVRRLAGIPKTSCEVQDPYAELSKRLLSKFRLKRSLAKT